MAQHGLSRPTEARFIYIKIRITVMSEYGDLSLEHVGGYMFMDNLYFHTINVHVSVCIND